MTRLGWWVHSEIIHFEKNPGAAPAHLEFSFGMQERRGSDPASTGEPLVLSGGELEIRARGIIDRVDAAPDGRAWVIDYKTGASSSIPTYSEVADGNSFQLFVYLLAVEQLLGFDPAAGFYLMVAEPPGARGSLPQRSALSCGEKPVQKASSPGRSCGSASWACSGPMPRTSPRAAFRCFPCPLIPRPLQARALLDCDARRGEAPEEAPEHRMARTALLAAAGELMARWGKIQDAQGMMDFDGLLSRARDLLRDRPEVRALYQRQFRYVHIDEFQDVDGVQAELVRLLCGFEGSEVEHPPRLFIVGDPQQSIYRFRGADVDQFARMERLIRDRAGRSLCLRRCFRSQARLVGFFNHTFERVFSSSQESQARYAAVESVRPANPAAPAVEFLFLSEGKTAPQARQAEAEALSRRLRQLLDCKEALIGERQGENAERRRAVRPGDIAILFRAMTDVGIYEQALRCGGIPFYTVAGSGFFARQEVLDALNVLRLLVRPHDRLSLAAVLRAPWVGCSDAALFWIGAEDAWGDLHSAGLRQKLGGPFQTESSDFYPPSATLTLSPTAISSSSPPTPRKAASSPAYSAVPSDSSPPWAARLSRLPRSPGRTARSRKRLRVRHQAPATRTEEEEEW